MAWQGRVLGLPGQQVKQSGESKAVTHTHTHPHPHTATHIRTLAARYNRFQEAGSDIRPDKQVERPTWGNVHMGESFILKIYNKYQSPSPLMSNCMMAPLILGGVVLSKPHGSASGWRCRKQSLAQTLSATTQMFKPTSEQPKPRFTPAPCPGDVPPPGEVEPRCCPALRNCFQSQPQLHQRHTEAHGK